MPTSSPAKSPVGTPPADVIAVRARTALASASRNNFLNCAHISRICRTLSNSSRSAAHASSASA